MQSNFCFCIQINPNFFKYISKNIHIYLNKNLKLNRRKVIITTINPEDTPEEILSTVYLIALLDLDISVLIA